MIVVGLPQIAALFIFESNWKMYIAYGGVTVLHWASLVFGWVGLRRQRKINTHLGLMGGVGSTVFLMAIHVLRFGNWIEHHHLSNINVFQLILYGKFFFVN